VVLPTLSDPDSVTDPGPTCVVSAAEATVGVAGPEPASKTVADTVAAVWMTRNWGVAEQVSVGGLRSTLIPLIGPAVAQLSALSQTSWLSVEAFAVSVPVATLVVSVNDASAGFARPEPVSAAVQRRVTLDACQSVSVVPQETAGGLLSADGAQSTSVRWMPSWKTGSAARNRLRSQRRSCYCRRRSRTR
jgi:hypothetical protein